MRKHSADCHASVVWQHQAFRWAIVNAVIADSGACAEYFSLLDVSAFAAPLGVFFLRREPDCARRYGGKVMFASHVFDHFAVIY